MIIRGFKTLESGLYQCEFCGTTLENENECKKHLEIETDLTLDIKLTESLKYLESKGLIKKVWDDSIQDFRIELTELGMRIDNLD